MTDRWTRLEELFEEASRLSPAEREAFLREACPNDPELRERAEALAAATAEAETFFDSFGAAVARWGAEVLGDPGGPDPESPEDPLVGAEVGRYAIEPRLGAGGMGLVYRAHDQRLHRPVALKVLPTHLRSHDGARERFLVEARAAASLQHPNVCTVHEVGESEAVGPFLAMALYEGETLSQRVARGALPIPEAVDVAAQVARGLAAAHERGVVHRDVKPGNVMLTPDGTAKILDFGLARIGDLQITEPGVRPGTLAYMSPEQIRGDDMDHRSDIWSLGVVLYEMLTGERPFRGPDAAVLHAIAHSEPAPLGEVRSGVGEGLTTVMEQLLSKDPNHRVQTAAEIPAALVAAMAEPHRSRRAWPRAVGRRRHGMPAVFLALLAIVLVGGMVFGLLGTRNELPSEPDSASTLAREMYLRGLEYLNRPGDADARKFPPAVSFFHRALEADPGYAPAHVGLSDAFRRNDRLPELVRRDSALHHAARAVDLGPDRPEAAAALGLAYAFAGERDRAESSFHRALELDPSQGDALSGLAQIAALNGRLDDAVRWERRAVRADPASARRLAALGSYLFDLGDLDEAAAAFRQAIEFSPDFPDPAYLLGHIRRIRGEGAAADSLLAEMTSAASDHPGTRGLAVRFHAARGRFELAARDMDVALSGPPVYEAYISMRLGEDARAAEYLSRAEEVLAEWGRDGFASPRLALQVAALRGDVQGVLDVLGAHWRSGLRQARPGPPWVGVYWIDHDPILDQVRDDPRFLEFLQRVRAELDSTRATLDQERAPDRDGPVRRGNGPDPTPLRVHADG
jgi:eukaryotic-like serine/threonine-protein kinase